MRADLVRLGFMGVLLGALGRLWADYALRSVAVVRESELVVAGAETVIEAERVLRRTGGGRTL